MTGIVRETGEWPAGTVFAAVDKGSERIVSDEYGQACYGSGSFQGELANEEALKR